MSNHPALPYLPFEAAKRRVEAGDFSFEAIGALAVTHGEKLIRDYDVLDRSALLTNESAVEYVKAYYAGCEGVHSVNIEQAAFIRTNPDVPVDTVTVVAHFHDADDLRHTDQWDVWVEFGALYGEC